MEAVSKELKRLMVSLESDWTEAYRADEDRPSIGTLGTHKPKQLPHTFTELIAALRSIKDRRQLVVNLIARRHGHSEAHLPATVKEMIDSRLTNDKPADDNVINYRVTLILAIDAWEHADRTCGRGDESGAIMWFGQAKLWQGVHYGASHADQMKFERAQELGRMRWLHDPKQVAKNEAMEFWKRHRSSYRSKADFARTMMDKFPEFTNQKVIEAWTREWDKAS